MKLFRILLIGACTFAGLPAAAAEAVAPAAAAAPADAAPAPAAAAPDPAPAAAPAAAPAPAAEPAAAVAPVPAVDPAAAAAPVPVVDPAAASAATAPAPATEPAAVTPAVALPAAVPPVVAPIGIAATPGAAPAAGGPASVTAVEPAAPAEGEKVPWRGSTLIYEQLASALSLDEQADPTYNPYYVQSLSIRPEWHFGDQLFTRLRFDLEQELTNSDETDFKNQIVYSDLIFDVGATGWTDPWAGIKAAGTIRMVAPISKASHAQTMRFAFGPGASLSRKFPVLEGITIRYGGRFNFRFHDFTTTQYDAPVIACGSPDSEACGRVVHTGKRNVSWDVTQGPGLAFSPLEKLTLDLDFQFRRAALYPLTDAAVETSVGSVPLLPGELDAATRYSTWATVDLSYDVLDELSISIGASTLSGQPSTDGERRSPFFNRDTTLYLDLGLNVEALISRI